MKSCLIIFAKQEIFETRQIKLICIWLVIIQFISLADSLNNHLPAWEYIKTEHVQLQDDASALFNQAQEAHAKGELARAIELYNQAVRKDTTLWQGFLQLGAANFALERLPDARKSINQAIHLLLDFPVSQERNKALSRACLVLGEIHSAEAHNIEAEKAFNQAIELNPQASRAYTKLAEIYLSAQKYPEAISFAQKAIQFGENHQLATLLLCEIYEKTDQLDEIVRLLNGLLNDEPKNTKALRYRAEVRIRMKDFRAALDDRRSLVQIEPTTANKLSYAALLSHLKLFNEAIGIYQEVVTADPQNKEAQTALAILLLETDEGSKAISQLEVLIESEPENATYRAKLGELYLAREPKKALAQYQTAANLAPTNANYQIGVGASLVKLRRFQEALPILKRVIESQPSDDIGYYAHTNLATALFELDDFANAAREFVWILGHQQDQKRGAVTLYFLGICFDKLGDYEQALKAYDQFLTVASTDNQLEIDKVKLRLPSLKRQIRDGQGKKK